MIFGINTIRDISNLSQIAYDTFEISVVAFTLNITTKYAIIPILILELKIYFYIFVRRAYIKYNLGIAYELNNAPKEAKDVGKINKKTHAH